VPLLGACTVEQEAGNGTGAVAGTGNQAGSPQGGAGSAALLPTAGAAASAGAGSGPGGASGQGGASGAPSAGAAGVAGSAGAGGTGVPTGPMPTMGCQAQNPGEEPQTWLTNEITVGDLPPTLTPEQVTTFTSRKYFVRLPVDYDHTKPYPVVFYGPGCGASNVESTPMMDQIKNDAIHVFLLQKGNCFSTGYPSPEVPYFTQALDAVQAKYCTDANHVYVSGYSSGAWLSNLLACAVGPRIRGIGTAAGGLRKATIDGYMCNTPAVGIFYSGENDTENPADRKDENGFQIGVMGARDRLIASNGCDPATPGVWAENEICQIWKNGCENNPVVYCIGPGDGHGRGDGKFNVSNKGFWDLWTSVP
jgi:poly(3-hydroxybutyrate) depolymerase